MEFTPQETQLIERLRKQERQWPQTRWHLLGIAAFILAVKGYILVSVIRGLNFDALRPIDVFIFAFYWPTSVVMFCFAVHFTIWAITDWHGNAKRKLLLKLLGTQQK